MEDSAGNAARSRREATQGAVSPCDGRCSIHGMKDPTEATEAQEQQAVVEYCELAHIPVFHIPNGGWRHEHTGAQLKRQGVRPGVPDLCIPVARGGFHGLYIEMKRAKGGRLTEAQRGWLDLLRRQGYCAECCHGAGEAIDLLRRYMAPG